MNKKSNLFGHVGFPFAIPYLAPIFLHVYVVNVIISIIQKIFAACMHFTFDSPITRWHVCRWLSRRCDGPSLSTYKIQCINERISISICINKIITLNSDLIEIPGLDTRARYQNNDMQNRCFTGLTPRLLPVWSRGLSTNSPQLSRYSCQSFTYCTVL